MNFFKKINDTDYELMYVNDDGRRVSTGEIYREAKDDEESHASFYTPDDFVLKRLRRAN